MANTIDPMLVLSPEKITELMGSTRTRGEYEVVLDKHAESGEIALNLSERFPGKTATAIRQSVDSNIRKLAAEKEWPEMKCLLDTAGHFGGTKEAPVAILVNLDAHAAYVASQADED